LVLVVGLKKVLFRPTSLLQIRQKAIFL